MLCTYSGLWAYTGWTYNCPKILILAKLEALYKQELVAMAEFLNSTDNLQKGCNSLKKIYSRTVNDFCCCLNLGPEPSLFPTRTLGLAPLRLWTLTQPATTTADPKFAYLPELSGMSQMFETSGQLEDDQSLMQNSR